MEPIQLEKGGIPVKASGLRPPPKKRRRMKKGKFELNCINYFLTYPTCSTPKEECVENIVQKYGDEVQWVVIAQEHHADGSLHLHMLLRFEEKHHFRSADCFDFITGQHGNYQSCRSVRRTLRYITKHDKKYLVHGDIDVAARLEKKGGNVADKVAKSIVDGQTFMQVATANMGYAMIHARKIKAWEAQTGLWREMAEKKAVPSGFAVPAEYLSTLSDEDVDIACWISTNLNTGPRPFATKGLYIYGATGLMKTSLIRQLDEYLNIYYVPMQEEFYDSYQDGQYDIIVLDEFKGQKPITFLNALIDGQKVNLKQKGCQYLKKQNLPVIILSNYTLAECYVKAVEKYGQYSERPALLDTLDRRLVTKHVKTPIEIQICEMVAEGIKLAATLQPSDSDTEGTDIEAKNLSTMEEFDAQGDSLEDLWMESAKDIIIIDDQYPDQPDNH